MSLRKAQARCVLPPWGSSQAYCAAGWGLALTKVGMTGRRAVWLRLMMKVEAATTSKRSLRASTSAQSSSRRCRVGVCRQVDFQPLRSWAVLWTMESDFD